MKILLPDPLEEVGKEILRSKFEIVEAQNVSRERLIKDYVPEATAILVRITTPVDKDLIDAGKQLKIIAVPGVGVSHIDVKYAREKGIKILTAPGVNSESVAELTIAHILNIMRKTVLAHNRVRLEGSWNKYEFMGRELAGKVLGIIGFGNIGRRVAELASAFKMEIIVYDPYVKDSLYKLVSLEELLRNSDVISINAPLTDETYHLISRKEISLMKKGVYIVCTSRGGILDEDAVAEAVAEGRVEGVGMDVLENEVSTEEQVIPSKLFGVRNFFVTPHLGAWTVEAQERAAREIALRIVNEIDN